MAQGKEYEMLFRLSAQLGQNFNSTFASAQKTLSAAQKEIQSLNKTQSDIASYTKQQQALTSTEAKLELYKQQLANVRQEMAEAGEYNSTLANKELELKLRVEQTEQKIDEKKEALKRLGKSLSDAGINTSKMAEESEKLGAKIDDLKEAEEKAAEEAERLGKEGVASLEALSGALTALGIAKAVKAIYNEFTACIDAAVEFESVMTGVAKTTDLSTSELEAMSQEIKELATIIPATTTELGAIAETAGQLGIAKDDLTDFTEIMAMLGTATNMTSDEAATLLAQFASITGMDASNYANLGSTIVALGNSYATTEKNIAEMSQSIAASGSIAGMSEADILALSAAVTSLGISSANGGTQMSKLISEINSAVSSGENLDAWANAAGMTAEQFATAWRDDAAGALNSFITGLNEAYESGEDIYSLLDELGITETRMVTMVTSLAKSGDRLTSTLATASSAWAENTALAAEAEKRYETTESKLVLLQNSYSNLKASIGERFTPELQKLYEAGAKVLQGINSFVEANPELTKALVVMGLEVVTLLGAMAAYNIVQANSNKLKNLWTIITGKAAAATAADAAASTADTAAKGAQATATNAATTAQTGLNAAMAANPVGAIITGVVLLTGALVALSAAANKQNDWSTKLTATTQKQKSELEKLTAEYEEACEVYGDTSEEASRLRYEVDELSNSIEANGQTVEEFLAECDEVHEKAQQLISDYEEALTEINENELGTLALIQKLSDLASQNVKTAATEEQMKAIIAELNEQIPELSMSYDDLTSSAENYVEVMKRLAERYAEEKRQEERISAYTDAIAQQEELRQQIAETTELLQEAQDAYDDAWYHFYGDGLGDWILGSWSGSKTSWLLIQEYTEKLDTLETDLASVERTIAEVEAEWEDYAEEQAEATLTTEEAAEQERLLNEALLAVQSGYLTAEQAAKYYNVDLTKLEARVESLEDDTETLTAALKALRAGFMTTEEAAKAFGFTVESLGAYRQITDITDEIAALGEAYQDAYDDAYSSITGQYKLWDKAAEVIPQDIEEINTALQTQTAYWHDYNVDLQSLRERAEYIEGLSELIDETANGDEDSVNFIAGLAQATDEQLVQMVEQWQELRGEQEGCAESMASAGEDYSTQLAILQQQLAEFVDELNLEDEAAAAAEATMDAYIKALEEGAAEATTIAQQLATQIGISLNGSSGSSGDSGSGSSGSGGSGGSSGGGSSASGTASIEEQIAEKIVQFGDAWGKGMNASKSGDNGIVTYGGTEYKIQNSGVAYDSSTPLYKAAVEVLGFDDRQIFGYNHKIYGYLDGHIQELEGRTLSKKGYNRLEAAMLANFGSYHTGGLVGDVATLSESEEFAKLLKGEFVSTPAQMQRFMTETLPQIASYEATPTAAQAIEAKPSQGASYTITISPQFMLNGISGSDEMEEKIRECSDELVEMVVDRLEEMGIDAKRGAYA